MALALVEAQGMLNAQFLLVKLSYPEVHIFLGG